MARWILGVGAVGMSVAAGGCRPVDEPPDPPAPEETDRPPDPVEPPAPDLSAAFDPNEVVLRVTDPASPCPAPTAAGWGVRRLFEVADGGAVAVLPAPDAPTGPDPLAATCVYRALASADPSPFVGVDPFGVAPVDLRGQGIPGVASAARLVLAPSGFDQAAMRDDLYGRFKHTAGLAERASPTATPPVAPWQRPRIVMVDTLPDLETPWPASWDLWTAEPSHGRTLAAMIVAAGCSDQVECPFELTASQALRREERLGGEGGEGGRYGTLSDLAFAVRHATDAWARDATAQAVGPLILNLSLGWHPLFGGGMPGAWTVGADGEDVALVDGGSAPFSWATADREAWPPDVAAVLDAVVAARCAGALVFAAAGNRSAGPFGQEGPLLPAAWQALTLGEVADCPDPSTPFPSADRDEPVLWAVGGVDADGGELIVGRPESVPVLTALGAAAWIPHTNTPLDAPFEPLTGTSVSTALVSTAAAMAWAYSGASDGAAVMEALVRASAPGNPVAPWALSRASVVTPSLDTGDGILRSRVVRPCEVAAVYTTSWWCKAPELPAFGDWGEAGMTPDLTVDWPGDAVTTVDCGDVRLYPVPTTGSAAEPVPCPDLVAFDPTVSPWVYPMPPTDDCGDCFINLSTRVLYLALNRLTDHTNLAVVLETATDRYRYALPGSAIPGGATEVTIGFGGATLPAGIVRVGVTGILDDRVRTYGLQLKP